MWHFTEDSEQRLRALCGSYAPTSFEMAVQKTIADRFADMGLQCTGDAIGNLYASINEDADFKIGIAAHCDEIGIQVTEITGQGLLRFRKLGGLRATSLIGHRVAILTETGTIPGIIGCDPLQDNGTDNGILVKTSDLWIDIGTESAQESACAVKIGDYGVFESDFIKLGCNRIAAKSLDDRLGVFVMEEVMNILRNEKLTVGLTAISTVQEEISYRGASACTKHLDAAIVLDVDFTTDIPTEHSQTGLLELGKGVGINRNADSNIVLQNMFVNVAKESGIPVQPTLSRNVSGGTDATRMQTSGNTATLNINIPLRYMHSQYELCDRRDIEYAVRAVADLIKFIDNNQTARTFVPWRNI